MAAGEVFGEHLTGATTDHLLELTREDRERIFNLGYFTWVEQQGVSIDEFRVRKQPEFWTEMRDDRRGLGSPDRSVQRADRGARDRRRGRRAVSAQTVQATSLVCSGCGASPAAAEPYPFRCPNAGRDGDTDHVLRRHLDLSAIGGLPGPGPADESPYVTYRRLFHAYHLGRAFGMADAEYVELVARLDERVAAVDGHGFRVTPFARADRLSERLGFAPDGGVWVKDETRNVSGSHKARHLFGLLVYLEVAERIGLVRAAERPALAIASCGNAALGGRRGRRGRSAAVLTCSSPWTPIRTSSPGCRTWARASRSAPASPESRETRRTTVSRRRSPRGPCRSPARATRTGSPSRAASRSATRSPRRSPAIRGPIGSSAVDRLVVQVGGGALASACFESLGESVALGGLGRTPRFHAVQTGGAWPLPRAFERIVERLPAEPAAADIDAALAYAARHRSAFMWPWEEEPRSIAHGILDDETYDWLAVVEGLLRSGGSALVVDEETLLRANQAAVQETGIDVDPDRVVRPRGPACAPRPRRDRGPGARRRPLHGRASLSAPPSRRPAQLGRGSGTNEPGVSLTLGRCGADPARPASSVAIVAAGSSE